MKFPGVEFLETAPKFRKRKKTSSSCVYVLHETSDQEISRSSRAVTAKKFTEKFNARAELLFWLQNLLLFDVFVAKISLLYPSRPSSCILLGSVMSIVSNVVISKERPSLKNLPSLSVCEDLISVLLIGNLSVPGQTAHAKKG